MNVRASEGVKPGKRKAIFATIALISLALLVAAFVVPASAATDTGAIYGTYNIDLSALDPLPDIVATNIIVTGSFVADGVEHPLERITVGSNSLKLFTGEGYSSIEVRSASSGDANLVESLSITFDTTQLKLSGDSAEALAQQWLFRVLRSSEWLDAPKPFIDSIRDSVASLVAWLGAALTAITSGEFSSLLPIIGISVAVSIVIFVFLLIKRSVWGE